MISEFLRKNKKKSLSNQNSSLVEKQDPLVDDQSKNLEAASNKIQPSNLKDDEINGVEIKEFAKRQDVSNEEVWKKIRAGQLIARTENGFVYVYGKNAPSHEFYGTGIADNQNKRIVAREQLPPLPTFAPDTHESNIVPMQTYENDIPEIALLLEHLNLAKSENTNLLKLSQDSIAKITDLSQSIIQSKEEIISKNEEKLESQQLLINDAQKELVAEREKNRQLLQKNEDLEMLANTLSAD